MNVYDCANELAKALRESHEYKKMMEAKALIAKDEDTKKMINEFLKLNQDAEIAKMQGQEVPKDTVEKIQKLYGILSLNRDAMEYLNAFMRFQMMMADIGKTINEAVKTVVED